MLAEAWMGNKGYLLLQRYNCKSRKKEKRCQSASESATEGETRRKQLWRRKPDG